MNPWHSIDRQATIVATGVGAATILAVRLGMALESGAGVVFSDLFLALVAVGAFCTLLFYKLISRGARAIDAATERLLQAAHGDLKTPVPARVIKHLPDLSVAMESLFSQTRTNLENVHTLAMFDPVTGLANRTSFCRQVERLLTEREMNGPAVMFFIDLDHFKSVNDTFGHAAGDHVLTRVAGRLREVAMMQVRGGGDDAVIGRLAGDEFTIFFPSMSPETSAMRVARAVQYALGEPFDIGGTQIEIGASIGVAYYPEHGATLASLLRAADHAMYDAKNAGRRQVQLYSKDLELRIAGKVEMERELRNALENDEFLLQFQPQIDVRSGNAIGAEALVRWAHPSRDLIMPDAFVALAEETGVIVDLGNWIMNRVCETAARWADAGLNHRLSINISRRELAQPDFFSRLAAMMKRYGTPPTMLGLELTESLSMKLTDDLREGLVGLRQQGILIAIDDFGTGFSNLARLKDLPVDRVKIDRSLVRDIAISEEARVICAAVIGLVQGLDLEIVIEGVESEDQVEILRVMGCTIFQGFHLSRPVEEHRYFERFGDAGALTKNQRI